VTLVLALAQESHTAGNGTVLDIKTISHFSSGVQSICCCLLFENKN
jgi:hypothetical protein